LPRRTVSRPPWGSRWRGGSPRGRSRNAWKLGRERGAEKQGRVLWPVWPGANFKHPWSTADAANLSLMVRDGRHWSLVDL
jgi:hypothetical protein